MRPGGVSLYGVAPIRVDGPRNASVLDAGPARRDLLAPNGTADYETGEKEEKKI
jgi:hypothetical protein